MTAINLDSLVQGDAFDIVKEIPDNYADCICIDPPYGISYYSGHYKGKNPHKKIIGDANLHFPLDELWRILKPTGAMFVFYSQKYQLSDPRIKNTIVWVKDNWTAGNLEGDFGNQYELIAFMPKDKFKIKGKRFSNVWECPRIPADKLQHPTQKPLALISKIITCATKQGEVVLDCYAGSGTTLVAAKRLGRHYIGIELESKYIEVAKKRLADYSIGLLEAAIVR
jgi:site-specific DNA-methyltransferase (adenine-specific)